MLCKDGESTVEKNRETWNSLQLQEQALRKTMIRLTAVEPSKTKIKQRKEDKETEIAGSDGLVLPSMGAGNLLVF